MIELPKIYEESEVEIINEFLSNDFDKIDEFKKLPSISSLNLSLDSFYSYYTTGTIAICPNLLEYLFPNLDIDKEGLILMQKIPKGFILDKNSPGLLFGKDFCLLPDSLFKKHNNELSSYNVDLLKLLWNNEEKNIEVSVAIDKDRVRLNTLNHTYREKDFFYGPKFTKIISDINDGNTILYFPLDIDQLGESGSLFEFNYRINLKWTTNNTIKSFYAYEFKARNVQVKIENKYFHPVKYLHAEYDCAAKSFRHIDGSTHFYSEDEYENVRTKDIDFNRKNNQRIKAKSKKLFKINGEISEKMWAELLGCFFYKNPLIFEYFEGDLPDFTKKLIKFYNNGAIV